MDKEVFSGTGVNHASRLREAISELKFAPGTRQLLQRYVGIDGEIIGYAHRFLSSNQKLIDWVSSIVSKERIQIAK